MGFLQMIPYERFNKSDTSFEDKMSHDDNLSFHSSKTLYPHLFKGSFVHSIGLILSVQITAGGLLLLQCKFASDFAPYKNLLLA